VFKDLHCAGTVVE